MRLLQLDLTVCYNFNIFQMSFYFHLATLNIRHAHTDIQVPNFDYYRRKGRLDASKSYRDAGDATSPYSYLAPVGKHTVESLILIRSMSLLHV
jgi:hypothetical protein